MNRFKYEARVVTAALVVFAFLNNSIVNSARADYSRRPNFLFVVVDDQSPFDLGIYDPTSQLETPEIDKIASQGIVIDRAYHMGSWSGAVCTPSRHMIMSGRTLWHLPRNKRNAINDSNSAPSNLEEFTMAAVFNRSGYDTMRTCKNGNSYNAANNKFQASRTATKRGGTAETGSPWHAEQVLDFLGKREKTKDGDPFLIYFGFSHPHDVRDGTKRLLAKYGAVNHKDPNSLPPFNSKLPPLPINYLPKHPFHHGHPRLRDEVNVSGVWKRRDEQTIRNEIGRQFACCENIDIQIGRVLKKIESMGELNNTYIFYTSDHGMAIGRHGLQGKQNLYEHTWRVPMIVKGPGIKPGSRAHGNIYLLDVLSTMCDLAGITAPTTNEGESFKSVLFGQEKAIRDVLYGAYCGGTKPGIRCIRKGDWKLIKYETLEGKVRQTQLFNLAENPNELIKEHHSDPVNRLTNNKPDVSQINLADIAKYSNKRNELEKLLLSEQKRLDDPYRFWDQQKN